MRGNQISQDVINDIRTKTDIVDVISSYIPLTARGKNFFGVCPFHADHSPSMSVSKEKQIYTCFSCGATGNVFKFLMDYENIGFVDAVKICADKVGIPLITSSKKEQKQNVLYDIYELAQKFYQNNINTEYGVDALNYLKNRHFDDEVIKTFGIGLSLNKKTALTDILINKKFDLKVLENSGLVLKRDGKYADTYSGRIMFPLYDLTGRIVGYSGRIYTGTSASKYFNTRETEIFKKGEILYNYHRAKDEVRKENKLIVVEGFMDVIRLHTVGIKNVIATMGTAVTKNQALLMRRLSTEIILCFDGDEAGNEATNSCINELEKLGVIPKVVRLEQNLDPDEYILKFGKDKFVEKINNPINSMDFKMSYLKNNKEINNSLDMSNYVESVLNELGHIENDIYITLTLQKLAEESGLSVEYLKGKIKKQNKVNVKKQDVIKLNKYEIAERNLMYYLLNNKEAVKLCIKYKPNIVNEEYKKLLKEILNYYKIHNDVQIADLITEYHDSELIDIINKLLVLNLKEEANLEEVEDYLKLINKRDKEKEIEKINKLIKEETDALKKAELLKQIVEIRKEMDV